MRTFWSFSATCRVLPGGHDGYEPGEEFCVQVLVPTHVLQDALPVLQDFLAEENLELLDVLSCCRFDLDDPEQDIADYVRMDHELMTERGKPVISVYVVVAKERAH